MVKKKNYRKIIISTSSFISVEAFLLTFIKTLSNDFEVFVITNLNQLSKDEINNYKKKYNFKLLHIPIKRKINLFICILLPFSLVSQRTFRFSTSGHLMSLGHDEYKRQIVRTKLLFRFSFSYCR